MAYLLSVVEFLLHVVHEPAVEVGRKILKSDLQTLVAEEIGHLLRYRLLQHLQRGFEAVLLREENHHRSEIFAHHEHASIRVRRCVLELLDL